MRLGQLLILAIAINCTNAIASDAPYIYGTPNGCLVQLKTPLKTNEHVQWHGDCGSEFANGAGVLVVLDNSGKTNSALRMTMQKGIQSGSAVPVENPSAYRSNDASKASGQSSQSRGSEQSGSPCQPTMAFLSGRIPNFAAPELQAGRQAILAENVRTAMSKARAQGFTSQGAVKAALDQAKEFDRISREATQCASDVDALGATDDDFLAAMRQGKAPSACTGIRNSCLCAGILNRMTAVGIRALAAEMQCLARNGG